MKIEDPPSIRILDYNEYKDQMKIDGMEMFISEAEKRYFYWTEIKYRTNLPFGDAIKAWQIIKTHRKIGANSIDFGNHRFSFKLTNFMEEKLHQFDVSLLGGEERKYFSTQNQKEYLSYSFAEEAIASSQIEGAATTTDVAREMIRSGRKARNESEQMIINNFHAIREIEQRSEEELSLELILDIHQLMTLKTEAAKHAGSFRDHPIFIKDHLDGEIAYTAPNYTEVNKLLTDLEHFINSEKDFYHPFIKASILHFMIGYIHPFGDGNGRTARALFYWFMIKKGYGMLKHISISKAILNSRTSYDKAFLRTEHDQNDLNYFIMYSIKSFSKAYVDFISFLDEKKDENQRMEAIKFKLTQKGFNKRQADLMAGLIIGSNTSITVPQYCKNHGIVRQTATRDFVELINLGILQKIKDGKAFVYELVDHQSLIDTFEL